MHKSLKELHQPTLQQHNVIGSLLDLKNQEIAFRVFFFDGSDYSTGQMLSFNEEEETKEQVQRDKEKDRFLISEGYTVIRFTGSEIYNNCIEKVNEFLNIVFKECDR